MSKTITLRISEDHYQAFKTFAQKENRKIANAIETLALIQLEKAHFTEDIEAEGILSDENLLARIKGGRSRRRNEKAGLR